MRSTGDHLEHDEQAFPGLILELRRREHERIRRLEFDGWRRVRILDRAVDKLLSRMNTGRAPTNPGAWFRRTVDNLIKSKEIPWSRELLVDDLELHCESVSDDEARDIGVARTVRAEGAVAAREPRETGHG